jgi:hypothetical protein
MKIMRGNVRQASILAITLVTLVAIASAGTSGQSQPPENPNDLVRETVQNELKISPQEIYLTWKQRTVKPNRTIVRQMVETPDGLISRLLSINDRPLTVDEQRKEDARVNRLLDPSQMRQKRNEQKEDEARTRKMVAAIPDAFLFQYAGTEEKDGRTMVNLKFTPNPNFDPPSRETLVFQGMAGDIAIDATAKRLAKIDGTMMRDISIGWGIIGHLDKGGRFMVEQAPVVDNQWELTMMKLNFLGKALIFKTIRIDSVDTATDFRKVPRMTVQQALEMLKKSENPQPQNSAAMAKQ